MNYQMGPLNIIYGVKLMNIKVELPETVLVKAQMMVMATRRMFMMEVLRIRNQ